jgi:hypothetical protein
MSFPVVWRTTRPLPELDYRCDLCGSRADSAHFLPWVTTATTVALACPDHDPGGYWVRLRDIWDDGRDLISHIGGKINGDHAVALLAERIDQLRVVTEP